MKVKEQLEYKVYELRNAIQRMSHDEDVSVNEYEQTLDMLELAEKDLEELN